MHHLKDIYLIVFVVFTAAVFTQSIFLWVVFSSLSFFRNKKKETTQRPISVVVSARNEANNLQKYLPKLLEQDYPTYEVVLVNDQSDDETPYILKVMAERYPHLKVINMNSSVSFYPGKKFPLSIGIKSAKYEHILLTDADCEVGPQWINEMQAKYEDGKTAIVLSYGAYRKQKGLLNKLIRYYAFFTAEQYLSFAAIRLPYMGVGRNLSYTKSLFYQQKGFIAHYSIPSGDDDLFVNSAATRRNTKLCLSPHAYTYSQPKQSLAAWFRQKRRHISTGKFYKPWQRWTLSMYPFSLLVMLVCSPFLLASHTLFWWVVGLLSFRYLSFYIIQFFSLKRLKEKDLWILSPLWELLIFAINTLITIMNAVRPRVGWK